MTSTRLPTRLSHNSRRRMHTLRIVRFLLLAIACVPPFLRGQISIIGALSPDKDAMPGETYEGSILVKNDGAEPAEAKVYQTDYFFAFDGTNDYGKPGTMPRSNAQWVRFSPATMIIPALATATLNYSVTVPPTVTGKELSGTYWSMLMVEGIPKGSAESTLSPKPKKAEMGVRQTLRYGIQIATSISGTGKKAVRFVAGKLLHGKGGGTTLQVDIENNGTLGFRPEIYAELFDSKGQSLGKYPGARYRMYPGTSVRETIDLSKIPSGSYKALVVVDAGGEDVFGAQYTLIF